MAHTPNYVDFDFFSAALLNNASLQQVSNSQDITATLFTPGLVNANGITFTPSGLVVNIVFSTAVRLLFGTFASTGILAACTGIVNNVVSYDYSVDLTAYVPGSGSVTVYIVGAAFQTGDNGALVTGPSAGHPDYDPTFVPYSAYAITVDTVQVSPTFTPPDNVTYIEIGRVVLTSGQVSIPSIDTTHQVRAGAILSQTGEVVAADLAAGAASTNVGTLGGVLGGTLPNPTLASGAAATNIGTLGGDLSGTLPNPTIKSNVNLTGSPTTTPQPVGDSSTKIATTSFANPGAAISFPTGYVQLSSGLILQWGVTNALTTGNNVAVVSQNFNTPFPNACFVVVGNCDNVASSVWTAIVCMPITISTTGVTFAVDTANAAQPITNTVHVRWIAIGY